MKHLMTYYLKVSCAWRRKFAYTAEKNILKVFNVKLMFSDYLDSSRTWKGSSYLIIQMKRFQFFLLRKCLISFFISSFIHSFIWLNLFFVYWSIDVVHFTEKWSVRQDHFFYQRFHIQKNARDVTHKVLKCQIRRVFRGRNFWDKNWH